MNAVIAPLRGAFVWVVFFSFGVNLLMLALPLYLLQVFDRILTSRSVDTLWVLTAIVLVALVAYGILDALRRMMLSRLGILIESGLGRPVLEQAIEAAPLSGGTQSARGIADLQTLRGYLAGQGLLPLLDAPWSIVFLTVIFLLHPILGWLALAAFLGLAGFALLNERLTHATLKEGRERSSAGMRAAEHAVENSEVILAMGMGNVVANGWKTLVNEALGWLEAGTRRLQVLSSISKVARQMVQVAVLATGALLALDGAISPGAMIAASILVTRALAPVEQLIGSWGQTVAARDAWSRLQHNLSDEEKAPATKMPAPTGLLRAEGLTYVHPKQDQPVLQGINLELQPGESLGLIGPTGSGKTTLARCLLGVIPPRLGSVRLDGISLPEWSAEDRGQYIGYLPQDLELFPGTVAENIGRFAGEGSDEAVVKAAQLAGAHEMILQLPMAYETPVGPRGVTLSGGQRQRIALARAMFGNVRLVVLDEPNANQDRVGEEALLSALRRLKELGVTSVIIAHRPAIIRYVDKIMVLRDGKVVAYGGRDQVLADMAKSAAGPTERLA
ncbi:type I secretion system permease/ATPase [Congregibacter sp.]|uniref:type I secretion system permease/ATPase n=1 Tax=Congregibacter sp. TaxID=2744308 RepID=UPI0039E2B5D4